MSDSGSVNVGNVEELLVHFAAYVAWISEKRTELEGQHAKLKSRKKPGEGAEGLAAVPAGEKTVSSGFLEIAFGGQLHGETSPVQAQPDPELAAWQEIPAQPAQVSQPAMVEVIPAVSKPEPETPMPEAVKTALELEPTPPTLPAQAGPGKFEAPEVQTVSVASESAPESLVELAQTTVLGQAPQPAQPRVKPSVEEIDDLA